ncbi:MAG: hypothetical protein D6798_05905 [Deltaproteobacteria bacterium]|nr:MAG: hypothetical protein D6798_05905 [Deltaproteobacteria bacterium]
MTLPVTALSILLSSVPALAEPSLALVDPGAEPRRPLRFHPAPGTTEQVRMTMEMASQMAMGGTTMPAMKIPPMILDLDLEVLEIEADGDIRYRFTIADTGVGAGDDVGTDVVTAMSAAMQPLEGTSGEVTVSPTGVSRDATLTPSAGADPQMVADMRKSMANASAPLPEEPVGVGARWTLTSDMNEGGLQFQQVASYELVELTDTTITLRVDVQQSAEPQAFAPDGLPPGATAVLSHMGSKGSGSTVLRFDRVMPTRSDMQMHTDMTVNLQAQGQSMDMQNSMDMTTTIAPR